MFFPLKRRIPTLFFNSIVVFLGLFFSVYPIIFYPHDGFPGDFGDGRLNLILLEHSYQWLMGTVDSFWNPTWVFYPFKNGLALGEVMVGSSFPYLMLRFFDFDLYSSYQWWVVCSFCLNYAACFFLLRKLETSSLGASAGAFLFSFALPRIDAINHVQLIPHYQAVLGFLGLVGWIKSEDRKKRFFYMFLFALSLPWQFWSSIYFAFFHIFIVISLFLLACLKKDTRLFLLKRWKTDYLMVLTSCLCASILLWPIVSHYLDVVKISEYRPWSVAKASLIKPENLITPPASSFFYPSLHRYMYAHHAPSSEGRNLFFGFSGLLAPLALYFLYLGRRKSSEKFFEKNKYAIYCLFFSSSLLIWFFSYVSPSWLMSYRLLYNYLPGFASMRAAYRSCFALLLIHGAAYALLMTFFEWRISQKSWGKIVSFIFLAFLIIENSSIPASLYFSKKSDSIIQVEEIKNKLFAHKPYPCKAFYLAITSESSVIRETKAMLASLETHIPTINGYSGMWPPHYPPNESWVLPEKALKVWLDDQKSELFVNEVCVIK